jgi:hypothetical protein
MATIVPIAHSPATLRFLAKEFNMNYLKNLLSLSNVDGFSTMSDEEQRCVVHWIQVLGLVIKEDVDSPIARLVNPYFSEMTPIVDLLVKLHFSKMTPEEVSWALEYSSPDTLIFLLENPSSQLSSEQRMKAANRLIDLCNYDALSLPIQLWDHGQIWPLVQLTLEPMVTEVAICLLSDYNETCSYHSYQLSMEQIRASVEIAVLEHRVGQFLSEQWTQLDEMYQKQKMDFWQP